MPPQAGPVVGTKAAAADPAQPPAPAPPSLPPASPSPPLLLTRRLTTLLYASLTPQIQTIILATPSGKLLAHASSHPVSFLRAQSAAAACMCAIHHKAAAAGAAASPPRHYHDDDDDDDDDDYREDGERRGGERERRGQTETGGPGETGEEPCGSVPVSPTYDRPTTSSGSIATSRLGSSAPLRSGGAVSAITVHLASGIAVIRRLRCGLLFMCIGPVPYEGSSNGAAAAAVPVSNGPNGHHLHHHHPPHQHRHQNHHPNSHDTAMGAAPAYSLGGLATPQNLPSSPAETADSAASAAANTSTTATTATTAITTVGSGAGGAGAAPARPARRQAEVLVRWLDEKLGSLRVPEEGIGVGGF